MHLRTEVAFRGRRVDLERMQGLARHDNRALIGLRVPFLLLPLHLAHRGFALRSGGSHQSWPGRCVALPVRRRAHRQPASGWSWIPAARLTIRVQRDRSHEGVNAHGVRRCLAWHIRWKSVGPRSTGLDASLWRLRNPHAPTSCRPMDAVRARLSLVATGTLG